MSQTCEFEIYQWDMNCMSFLHVDNTWLRDKCINESKKQLFEEDSV